MNGVHAVFSSASASGRPSQQQAEQLQDMVILTSDLRFSGFYRPFHAPQSDRTSEKRSNSWPNVSQAYIPVIAPPESLFYPGLTRVVRLSEDESVAPGKCPID